MKLSPNFTLKELTESPTTIKLGIDNTPSADQIENMRYLCETVLEKVRTYFNKPITVNSCYRGPALNKAIGGSTTSSHMNGEAADIEITGISNKVLADYISEHLPYDQVILEFFKPEEGPNSGWVHVSCKKSGNRKQKLVALKDGGKTVYKPVTDFDPTNSYEHY